MNFDTTALDIYDKFALLKKWNITLNYKILFASIRNDMENYFRTKSNGLIGQVSKCHF